MNKIKLTLLLATVLFLGGCATKSEIIETDKWIKIKQGSREVWIDQRRLELIPPGYTFRK